MKSQFKLLSAAIIATALTACGGGSGGGSGGSTPTPVTNQDPQGFWNGTSSFGYDIASVVLENGEFYSMFSRNGIVYGIDHGWGSVSGSTISGTLKEFVIYPYQTVVNGTISATFTPKTILQGSTNYSNGLSGTFNTTYNSSYDTPATLAQLTGTYRGNYSDGYPVNLSISSNGVISGSYRTCTLSGTATPRASGKNVYNMDITFSGPTSGSSVCNPWGTWQQGNIEGIAVLNATNNSTYLYTAGINGQENNGFFWIGQKQ